MADILPELPKGEAAILQSAIRAGIIEKLVRIGFLGRKGDKKVKYLIPTHKGISLTTVMPEQIQSASITADWEEKLKLIEQKNYSGDSFMDEIIGIVFDLFLNRFHDGTKRRRRDPCALYIS